jgi:ubiquinone/menaquinone biosynthesis C-methylase UbiE
MPGKPIDTAEFEKLYIRLRDKEGRIYSDEELKNLPDIAETHAHFTEWQMRKTSSQKLIQYLTKKYKPLDILEIGCGNGWLSHRLSLIPRSEVIGTDINFVEIQQAERVFQHVPNLQFMYVQVEPGLFPEKNFDVIVFAASIQYFPSISETIKKLLPLLKPDGEIHIIDSNFYSSANVKEAKHRSRLYYEAAGFPAMADYYFHHSLEELQGLDYSILYNPNHLFNRMLHSRLSRLSRSRLWATPSPLGLRTRLCSCWQARPISSSERALTARLLWHS